MRTAFIVLALFNVVLVAWFLVGDREVEATADVDSLGVTEGPEIRIITEHRDPETVGPPGLDPAVPGQVEGSSPAGELAPLASSPTSGAPQDEQLACELLGPFIEARLGNAVLGRVRDQGYVAESLRREVRGTSDYWVYYPPLPTRKEALRQLKELQARNIDSYVITQGELVNGISLGLFTQRASAEGLRGRMTELGYRVEIQEVSRSHQEFWVSLVYPEAAPPGGGAGEMWGRLMADFPLMQRRTTSCA